MTMTKYWVDGVRGPSSHAVLTRSPSISEAFKARSQVLYEKYYPIEVSHTVTREEKFKAMDEWWRYAHELIVDLKLSRSDLARMVVETPVTFRAGLTEVIDACERADAPFLVFSAGLYDVIHEILERANLKRKNVHIVSNRMQFDENGVCVAFYEPMIHVLNKNEAKVEGSPYAETLVDRKNVILMGDSLGDLQMADGLETDTLLTIGFLNHDEERLAPEYLAAFDLVVTGDQSFEFLHIILNALA
ncbi:5'-nucleotidase, cytosolic III-like [Phlyctochytrium bullatum]|nr:5'-nucleotidase, cytosolic III-like [Phlyctochytrium bullatum]